jgi:hypothetical protein
VDVRTLALLTALAIGCSSSSTSTPSCPTCSGIVTPSTCPAPTPSWKNDVEPLVQKYCWQCHGTGGMAQGNADLSSYATVKPRAGAVLQAVATCLMPNCGATPPPMAYPTTQERNTIIAWAGACGAPNN